MLVCVVPGCAVMLATHILAVLSCKVLMPSQLHSTHETMNMNTTILIASNAEHVLMSPIS